MPSTAKNLEDLPNELLGQCFSHLGSNPHNPSIVGKNRDVQNLRLVSKKCHANSSPFLILSATVSITSASLSRFEELCSHSIFSKSIKRVALDCSYYDECMARSLSVYGYHCGTKLYRNLEMYERSGHRKKNNPVDERALVQVSNDWCAFNAEGFLQNNPKLTKKQQWLLDIHGQYQNSYEDQVRVKTGGAHIQRICAALINLPQLHSLSLSDGPYYPVRVHRALSDADILDTSLLASTWKGSFATAFLTRPPVEIIPDLFIALADTKIRPIKFTIDVKPPTNLSCLKLQEPTQHAIKTVISRVQELSFKMQRWARRDSLAEDNTRPRSEMLALCSLTSAYFDSSTLSSLRISFDEFPAFHEPPTVSISDILPLETQLWPQLHTLSLRYVPLTITDATMLVGILKGHLKSFKCWCSWLVQGSWIEVVDNFRELDLLQSFEIDYPKGGEFADVSWNHPNTFLKQEVEKYVLKAAASNPLTEFFKASQAT